jgi:hypothetical protein
MRLMGYLGLTVVISVAVGLLSSGGLFHKVVLAVIVASGLLIVGLMILLARSKEREPEL